MKGALRILYFFLTDVPVGLLIGSNCPKVLQPLKVIPTSDDGTFAVKHLHGWTIGGSIQLSKWYDEAIKVKEVFSPDNVKSSNDAVSSQPNTSEVPNMLRQSIGDAVNLLKSDTKNEDIDSHFVSSHNSNAMFRANYDHLDGNTKTCCPVIAVVETALPLSREFPKG